MRDAGLVGFFTGLVECFPQRLAGMVAGLVPGMPLLACLLYAPGEFFRLQIRIFQLRNLVDEVLSYLGRTPVTPRFELAELRSYPMQPFLDVLPALFGKAGDIAHE